MSRLGNIIEDAALAQQGIYRAAMSNHPAQRKIDAILRAYDQALLDPQTKMPTTLHLAIESARA